MLEAFTQFFGVIFEEKPKHQLIRSTPDYEIRLYEPAILCEVTFDPAEDKVTGKDAGVYILANYIGALGKPQNTKAEKISMTVPIQTQDAGEEIAMTAPVVTRGETIAMTAPVITQEAENIAMTAPVITKGDESGKKLITAQLFLPWSKYSKLEDVPKPTDPRVVIKRIEARKIGVVVFNGTPTDKVVEEKAKNLKNKLEADGYTVIGEYSLGRYNPPWTLPPLRTNEIYVPVQ